MKTEISEVKDFYDKAVRSGKKAYNTAKDIIICPKVDASFKVKSNRTNSDMFKCNFKCDKEISLLKIIAIVFGFIAAFVLASMFVNSLFDSKKCKCKCDDNLNS